MAVGLATAQAWWRTTAKEGTILPLYSDIVGEFWTGNYTSEQQYSKSVTITHAITLEK